MAVCRVFRSRVRCARRLRATAIVAFILLYVVFALRTKVPRLDRSLPWEFDHGALLTDDLSAASPPSNATRRPPIEAAAGAAKPERTSGNQTSQPAKLGSRATLKPTQRPACPKTMTSLARHSKWFGSRFRPKVKLFLDRTDADNKTPLLGLGLPYGVKGQNLTVFEQILRHENFTNPPIEGDGDRRRAPCLRCAVVGSGGVLNGSKAGKEIDAHDYVFRVNQAVTHGSFAEDVGRRTTFYTFFPESQQLWEIEDKTMVALYVMYRSYDVSYALKTMQQDRSSWSETINKMKMPVLDPHKLKIFHPGFLKYVLQSFLDGKARPTTGSIVVAAALHICDEVDIYGFGYDPKFSLHYYDHKFIKHTMKSTQSHNVQNERRLWDRLHAEGVIRLFKRDA